jgi:hypothetical protein
MDLIEVLVLIAAVGLIALLVAAVLVVVQALFSSKKPNSIEESAISESPTPAPLSEAPAPAPTPRAPSDIKHSERVEPKVVVDTKELFVDEVTDYNEAFDTADEPAFSAQHLSSAEPDWNSSFSQPERQPTPSSAPEERERAYESRMNTSDDHRFAGRAKMDIAGAIKKAEGSQSIKDAVRAMESESAHRPKVHTENYSSESSAESEQASGSELMIGRSLLTPIERLFYTDLKASIANKAEIFPKVRALDVIDPKKVLKGEEALIASEQLVNQRFDFVLCDPDDLSVLCIIELEGSDEEGAGLRKLQREILRRTAESASVPVVLVDTRLGYTRKELKERIRYLLPKTASGYINELLLDDSDGSSSGQEESYLVHGSSEEVHEAEMDELHYEEHASFDEKSPVDERYEEELEETEAYSFSHDPSAESESLMNSGYAQSPLGNTQRQHSETSQAGYQATADFYQSSEMSSGYYQADPHQAPGGQYLAERSGTHNVAGSHNIASGRNPNGHQPHSYGNGAQYESHSARHGHSTNHVNRVAQQRHQAAGNNNTAAARTAPPNQAFPYQQQVRPNIAESVQGHAGHFAGQHHQSARGQLMGQGPTTSVPPTSQCPRCGSSTKLSMATRGEYQGQYFWVCTNMPSCTYVGSAN